MKDKIVDEVRKIRKEIESENNDNWDQLLTYFEERQKRHKNKLYKGAPKSLPKRDVA
ncbi:hypothetical protein IIC38_07875 [candidate division KSB1 bacterium]|nr:hypothetical protein [candidate division KSB1 bacterium]